MYGNLNNNDYETTFKRIVAHDSKWGRRMRTFEECFRISRYLLFFLVEKSHLRERTTTNTNLQKGKTTTSKQCPSKLQRIPANAKFPQNFPYAGVRWANSLKCDGAC